jgi:hypothetical protein
MTEIERTISQLQRAIAQTSNPRDRRISEAMMLLIAAAEWGTNAADLIDRTGLKMDFIVEVATRMRAAVLWTGADVITDGWWDDLKEFRMLLVSEQALVGLGE